MVKDVENRENHYEKWCRELSIKGEDSLKEPVTRKEHVRSIIEIRCDFDKIIAGTTVAIVLGIIDLLWLIISALLG